MQAKIHIKTTCLAAALIFGCLVVAQQPATDPVPQPTTKAPAPAPAPVCKLAKEKPSPTVQNFHLFTCIVAKFAAYIRIGENDYLQLAKGVVNEKLSNCPSDGNKTENPKLVVDFECGQLEFQITKNDTQIFVKSINGQYKVDETLKTFSNTSELFVTTQTGHYYKCNSEQAVILRPGIAGDVNQTYQLMLSNFAYETYRSTSGTDFYKIAEECTLDSGPFSDGVRIGVGVCLIAFVAIILIAYFVGRRRWSQRSSYESV